MSKRKCDDNQIVEAISDRSCRSIAAVVRKLNGMRNYDLIKRIAAEHRMDTSHWLGNRVGVLKRGIPTKDVSALLRVYSVADKKPASHHIKLRLIRDGLKQHRCEKCQGTEWHGALMPICLNHINGNNRDYRFDNLEILCPNCHALTPTFAGRNKKLKAALAQLEEVTRSEREC